MKCKFLHKILIRFSYKHEFGLKYSSNYSRITVNRKAGFYLDYVCFYRFVEAAFLTNVKKAFHGAIRFLIYVG